MNIGFIEEEWLIFCQLLLVIIDQKVSLIQPSEIFFYFFKIFESTMHSLLKYESCFIYSQYGNATEQLYDERNSTLIVFSSQISKNKL